MWHVTSILKELELRVLHPPQRNLLRLLDTPLTYLLSTLKMSTADWDSKVVIGYKAKTQKVTRNTSDLNGKCKGCSDAKSVC